jgi:hypothetical protein
VDHFCPVPTVQKRNCSKAGHKKCPRDDRSNLGRSGFRMSTVFTNGFLSVHLQTRSEKGYYSLVLRSCTLPKYIFDYLSRSVEQTTKPNLLGMKFDAVSWIPGIILVVTLQNCGMIFRYLWLASYLQWIYWLISRENERQSAPDVLVVDSGGETHEVSANVTVETSATPVVKSRSQMASELSLVNFGLSVPHDILLGKWKMIERNLKKCFTVQLRTI